MSMSSPKITGNITKPDNIAGPCWSWHLWVNGTVVATMMANDKNKDEQVRIAERIIRGYNLTIEMEDN